MLDIFYDAADADGGAPLCIVFITQIGQRMAVMKIYALFVYGFEAADDVHTPQFGVIVFIGVETVYVFLLFDAASHLGSQLSKYYVVAKDVKRET